MSISKNGPLRVGVGGPVGSGKTALMDALCKRLRDRYQLAAITNDSSAETLLSASAVVVRTTIGISHWRRKFGVAALGEALIEERPLYQTLGPFWLAAEAGQIPVQPDRHEIRALRDERLTGNAREREQLTRL